MDLAFTVFLVHKPPRRGGGGGILNEVLYGETLSLLFPIYNYNIKLIIIFFREKVSLHVVFYWQMVLLSHTLLRTIGINHKTRMFSQLFHSHKTRLLYLTFSQPKSQISLPFHIPQLKHEKSAPFGQIGHYREYFLAYPSLRLKL